MALSCFRHCETSRTRVWSTAPSPCTLSSTRRGPCRVALFYPFGWRLACQPGSIKRFAQMPQSRSPMLPSPDHTPCLSRTATLRPDVTFPEGSKGPLSLLGTTTFAAQSVRYSLADGQGPSHKWTNKHARQSPICADCPYRVGIPAQRMMDVMRIPPADRPFRSICILHAGGKHPPRNGCWCRSRTCLLSGPRGEGCGARRPRLGAFHSPTTWSFSLCVCFGE